MKTGRNTKIGLLHKHKMFVLIIEVTVKIPYKFKNLLFKYV